MRKIDKFIAHKKDASNAYDKAGTECKEALRLYLTEDQHYHDGPAARIDEEGFYVRISSDRITVAELDKIHAWVHDMLDEQPE